MITAIDTSVLIDVFGADARFGPGSRDAIDRCLSEGGLVVSDVVWAEVSGAFPSAAAFTKTMDQLGGKFSPLEAAAAELAGTSWRAYRRHAGERERIVADFLIGAHAQVQADRLLTRDRGFYRAHFRALRVLDPATPST